MKKVLTACLLLVSMSAHSEDLVEKYNKEWANLKPYQIETAKQIFKHAKKDDLQWSATAIAWQESQFGRWQINMNTPTSWDCGVFQNNTKSVAKHHDIPYSVYSQKEICTDLITSFNYAYLNFAKEIAFWERVHKGDWRKVWSSYNGGWAGNPEYAKIIALRIRVLKRYM